MGVLKINDLRSEAELKYGDMELETSTGVTVRLRNLLRLEDTARRNAQILIDSLDKKTEGETKAFDQLGHQENVLRDLFLLVSDNVDEMKREVDNWDLALRLVVLDKWMTDTQAGEASSSAS